MMNKLLRFKYGENNINTGPLKEIPEICVDHYVGSDLNSSVFFLSHAHTDHMVGLETNDFLRRLNQPGVHLYCHFLTPIFLGSFERYLGGPDNIKRLISRRKIVPLDVQKPKIIKIPRITGQLDVKVTLLSSGHCPGAVMFLFEVEKSGMRILHTGDFRLTLDDLKGMPQLHNNNKEPKPIDHLYIDTTFCSDSWKLFPNRKMVLHEAIQKIRSWISSSKDNKVYISFSARFAHEYVLKELYDSFQQRIHVTKERFNIYREINELSDIVTLKDDTQFHLCSKKDCIPDGDSITLRLSSMWYTKQKASSGDAITWHGSFLTLCYSMHSSLEEIGMTIDYLKPKTVTPLVLPKNTELSEVRESLKSVTTHSFELVDYHSSRDDFKGLPTLTEPCIEERDETDLCLEVEDKEGEIQVNDDSNHADSPIMDYPSPKKFKPCRSQPTSWQYSLSPSSKSSQNSSDGSQEIFLEGLVKNPDDTVDDIFIKPSSAPSSHSNLNCKKNLLSVMEDVRIYGEENANHKIIQDLGDSSTVVECSGEGTNVKCEMEAKDDLVFDSQGLL